MPQGPTIRIGAKTYDVNKDFTWRELLTVEDLGGVALAKEDAMDSMSVLAAFMFVVLKRDDPTLMWDGFLDSNIDALIGGDEPEEPKPAAKKRPTKASA